MSNVFAGLKKDGVKESEDRVGGFRIHETDIYDAEILAMYTIKSAGGAHGVHLSLKFPDGGLYDEDIYVTDREGKNTYTKDGVTSYLPGWNHADHIAICATGSKGLGELDVEDKTFKVYDANAKAQLPKSVPTFVEVIGKHIWVAILKTRENKSVKGNDGKYVPTAEERFTNSIDKVFDFDTKLTIAEAREGKPAAFYDQWLAQNKGKVRDNYKAVAGQGQAGRPTGAPPAAGEGNKPSLFGQKK